MPHPAAARRDFALLWAGQSTSLLGSNSVVLVLPLLAISIPGVSVAKAALIPFVMYGPWLFLGLQAGALVERLPRRTVMIAGDSVQAACYLTVAVLAGTRVLSLAELLSLVAVAGSAAVFFQVAYTSFLPLLYTDPLQLHRGNARLYISESVGKSAGPAIAGALVRLAGLAWAVAGVVLTFCASVLTVLAIRTRQVPPEGAARRERGWIRRSVLDGLRFVLAHDQLEPVVSCGAVYVLFLSVVQSSLVLYCSRVLGLGVSVVGLVVGAAAVGYPLGNMLSGVIVRRLGTPRTLIAGAVISVTGLASMPVAGSLGSVIGLVAGSVVHATGEGIFGPTGLTQRQLASPPELLVRVNSVARVLTWGVVPLGSLLASAVISVAGLPAALWVGGLGPALCLPVLFRRGIRTAVLTPASRPAPQAIGT
jgi:MFS family permease